MEPVERAALDRGAAVIGAQPAVDHAAGDALAAPGRAEKAEIDDDEIGRPLQKRRRV